jgi:copper chaperone CopZ
MKKRIYKIEGMHCDSCAKMLELDLEDAGVKGSCSYHKCTLEIELQQGIDEGEIKKIVEKSGYKISPLVS